MESQYTYRFDLNEVLQFGYLAWFIVFAVKTWKLWRDPLRRAFAWVVFISLLSEIEECVAKLLPLSLWRGVDYLAFAFTALPSVLLMVLVSRHLRRPAKHRIGEIFRIAALLILSISIGLIILIVALVPVGERLGGPTYNLGNPRDAARLRLMAFSAQPLTDALNKFESDNGHFPELIEEISPKYLDLKRFEFRRGTLDRFHYFKRHEKSYGLYRKLNWDAGLFYDHGWSGRNRWYYDRAPEIPRFTFRRR